jgi:predicted nucleic acid-binding protein
VLLLDADIVIDILRRVPEALAWLGSLGAEEVGLPGIAVMEVLRGEPNREAVARAQRALRPYGIYWPSMADCDRALSVYAEAKLTHGLDPFDALIGETAVGLDVPLCTFNVKHFTAIPGLVTIQPYVRPKR